MLNGLRVFESPYALETTDEPVKVHVRGRSQSKTYHRRIQKKWIKRWGYVKKPCIFKTATGLFVHPSLMAEVRMAINAAHR